MALTSFMVLSLVHSFFKKKHTSAVAFQDLCPYGHGTIPGIDARREGKYSFS